MNKVFLTGRLTKENELKYTTTNISVLQNSIAVKNDYKNSNGECETQFLNLVFWRNNAEFIYKYTKKGSKIAVEGKLQTRNYDKSDGTKGYITEVVVEHTEILDSFKKEENTQETTSIKIEDVDRDPFAEFGEQVDMDNFLD